MIEQERKLEQYKKWVSSYTRKLIPEARVALFCHLMSVPDFDGTSSKEITENYHFKYSKGARRIISRMLLRKYLKIGTAPVKKYYAYL